MTNRSNLKVLFLLALVTGFDSAVQLQIAAQPPVQQSQTQIPILMQALGNENAGVRTVSILAFVEMGPAAVTHLGKAMNASNSYVYQSAAIALKEIGSPQAVEALIESFGNRDELVRMEAAFALRDIAKAKQQPNDVVGALCKELGNPRPDIRYGAVHTLELIGPAAGEAVPALGDVLTGKLATDLHIQAAIALRQIGSDEAVATLAESLNHHNPQVREAGIFGLGKMRSEAAESALAEALQNDDASVRIRAVQALGTISPTTATPALIAALENGAPFQIRVFAALALGRTRIPDASQVLQALETAKSDKNRLVSAAATEALSGLNKGQGTAATPNPEP